MSKKRKITRKAKAKKPLISRTSACILAIVLLVCGGCCLFFGFFNMPIQRESAIETTGVYQRYIPLARQDGVELYLSDGSEYTIRTVSVSDELLDRLDSLPAGTTVKVVTHPRFHYVLALETNGEVLLAFEYSNAQQRTEMLLSLLLAVPWYGGAVYFGLVAWRQRIPKRKRPITGSCTKGI